MRGREDEEISLHDCYLRYCNSIRGHQEKVNNFIHNNIQRYWGRGEGGGWGGGGGGREAVCFIASPKIVFCNQFIGQ